MTNQIDQRKIREQVTAYTAIRPVYEEFVSYLWQLFTMATKRLRIITMISGRAKGIPNFAEKAIRKQKRYPDPVNMFDDLCGVRVIVNFSYEIEPICNLIRKYFDIDAAGSEDVGKRLGESEFGYRSVHYTISLNSRKLKQFYEDMGIDPQGNELPYPREQLFDQRSTGAMKGAGLPPAPQFRAEVQVRTLLAHAWAEFAHDRIYKSPFDVPAHIKRDTNRIAANLENAENEFSRTVKGITRYKTSLGPYQTKEDKEAELEKLETIIEYDPGNIELSQQIARLAMSLEDWPKVTDRLAPFIGHWEQSAVGKKFRNSFDKVDMQKLLSPATELDDPDMKELERLRDPHFSTILLYYGGSRWKSGDRGGRNYLEWAVGLDRKNSDALVALAETYHDENDRDEAFKYYERAYLITPTDPTSLCGYVCSKIMQTRGIDFFDLMKPSLEGAIQNCLDHIAVNLHLPQALFEVGFFYLLLGRPNESLDAFAKAVIKSDTDAEISETLRYLENLLPSFRNTTGVLYRDHLEWVIRYLWLAKYTKNYQVNAITTNLRDKLAKLSTGKLVREKIIDSAVRIVAGGADERFEEQLNEYRPLLENAFAGFSGVIFSGGTTSGICGIVGDLPSGPEQMLMKIAYLPEYTPAWTKIHNQYEVIYLKGSGFSPREPLQNWTDLLAAGVDPREVKLLAINGGPIAAFEIKLALSIGAKVGVVRGSGRAAQEIAEDEAWLHTPGLLVLPRDTWTIKEFVRDIPPSLILTEKDREEMAQAAHQKYLDENRKKTIKQDANLQEWEKLPPDLKDSNRSQVDHYEEKLRAINRTIRKAKPRTFSNNPFTVEEIELLAEVEHARWNIERLNNGWKLGKKDVEKKTSPYLIAWSELSEEIKFWDRDAMKHLPVLLEKYGYEIIPL
ncbi:MAG: hypothetical protein C4519_07215 [Desulfobacteraceae bacterium]|nr:MAG: hypothetical protein C4519_07215 [Desulfobacteraceae bacterium]